MTVSIKIEDSKWQPLWNFCNVDGDGEASRDEMISCAVKAAEYFEMPNSMQNSLYKILFTKYCGTFDQDRSGGLSQGSASKQIFRFLSVKQKFLCFLVVNKACRALV